MKGIFSSSIVVVMVWPEEDGYDKFMDRCNRSYVTFDKKRSNKGEVLPLCVAV